MAYQDIEYRVEDPVAVITLNRPDRLNAMTTRMLAEIRHASAAAETDPRVVGIILTGAGKGFCAGMDLAALDAISASGEISHEAPEGLAGEARYMLTFAEQHAAIIARFGRFPGRNAALGRPDTAEEAAPERRTRTARTASTRP